MYIAFSSNRAGPANIGSIYIVKPDGTGTKKISTGNMSYMQPAWTADGKCMYVYMKSNNADYESGFIQRIPSTVMNDSK